MKIKIDHDIPIPPKRDGWGRLTETMKSLKVGDSFVVDDKLKTSIYSSAKGVGFKVAIRRLGEGRWRVWRIA
jgi:hypothetical protein